MKRAKADDEPYRSVDAVLCSNLHQQHPVDQLPGLVSVFIHFKGEKIRHGYGRGRGPCHGFYDGSQ